jgi:hypothetical protein
MTFKNEYDRLLAMGVNRYPCESQLRPKLAGDCPPSDYEKAHQAWMLINMADCVTMDVLELDYLLRNDPQNPWAPSWEESMKQIWSEGNLTLAPGGIYYSSVLVDFKTKQVRRPSPMMLPPAAGDALDGWSFSRYIHGATMGWSTMLARVIGLWPRLLVTCWNRWTSAILRITTNRSGFYRNIDT